MVITDVGLNLVPLAARRYPGQPASSLLDDDDVNFALGALVYQTDLFLSTTPRRSLSPSWAAIKICYFNLS